MNYRHVFIFSKAIVGKHSFNNFIKDDTSLQNNSIDDIKKPEFKSVFIALYEIVKEARSLLDNLQSNDVFIHKSFKLVQNHIEFVFNSINNLDSMSEEDFKSDTLKYYSSYCKLKSFDVRSANTIVYNSLKLYLNSLLMRFTSLTGLIEEVEVNNIHSFKEYIQKVNDVNVDSDLFSIITLIDNYSEGKFAAPANLNKDIAKDYNDLKNHLSLNSALIKGDLFNVVEKEYKSSNQYSVLYFNLKACLCLLPTSCTVESLFSTMKNSLKVNMSDETLNSIIFSSLSLKGTSEDVFVMN